MASSERVLKLPPERKARVANMCSEVAPFIAVLRIPTIFLLGEPENTTFAIRRQEQKCGTFGPLGKKLMSWLFPHKRDRYGRVPLRSTAYDDREKLYAAVSTIGRKLLAQIYALLVIFSENLGISGN